MEIFVVSFDGIKNITSGEGGCVVTNNKKIIKILKEKEFRNKNIKNPSKWKPKVKTQGWRYHVSNIMAAIGIIQFKKKNQFKIIRKLAKNMTNY